MGTGDRSERIRTYNFPQSRVTDHRVNVTIHQLDNFLDGAIDPLIDALAACGTARSRSRLRVRDGTPMSDAEVRGACCADARDRVAQAGALRGIESSRLDAELLLARAADADRERDHLGSIGSPPRKPEQASTR